MPTEPTGRDPADTRLVIQPNASLTWRQARVALYVICSVTLAVGSVVAAFGYWPVLPFSGVVALSVVAALYWSQRAGLYREVITFEGDKVRLEFGLGEAERALLFNRCWLRVHLEPAPSRLSSCRLWLCCGGVDCEVGRCLPEEDREELAKRLRMLVGRNWKNAPRKSVYAAGC